MFTKMCYMINNKNKYKLNLNKKQDNSKLLYKKDLEVCDFDLKNMLGWPHYPNFCYATVIDNKIASCASAGYHANKVSDNIIEVSTKTHNEYRGKGYAVSNVVALCEYIFDMQEEKKCIILRIRKILLRKKPHYQLGLLKCGIVIFY